MRKLEILLQIHRLSFNLPENMDLVHVGVSSAFFYPDKNRSVFGPKSLAYLENDMARWLGSRPHWLPVLIPDLQGPALDRMLDRCDVFVFQGGTDLSPASYGATPIQNGRWMGDPFRDAYEFRLMEYALKMERPVLGICRGFQLLNAFLGGTLFQDIETEFPTTIIHRDAVAYDQITHDIRFESGGWLESIYAANPCRTVSSVHHQGIQVLAHDLNPEAFCTSDGLIEAASWSLDRPGRVMGVQWHPEFSHHAPTEVLNAEKLLLEWEKTW